MALCEIKKGKSDNRHAARNSVLPWREKPSLWRGAIARLHLRRSRPASSGDQKAARRRGHRETNRDIALPPEAAPTAAWREIEKR